MIELQLKEAELIIAVIFGILEILVRNIEDKVSDCLEHWVVSSKKGVVTSGAPGNA